MALPRGALLSPVNRALASSSSQTTTTGHGPRPLTRSIDQQACTTGRRGLLSLILLTATIPEDSVSKKALLQEYLKRSRENKAKNDKERLDDYYKRNYQDYFEFIQGSLEGKTEEQLTESEKGIRNWLQKNKK